MKGEMYLSNDWYVVIGFMNWANYRLLINTFTVYFSVTST